MAHGGRCECGGVRYEIHGAMRPVVVCHCGRCRRTHGDAAGYTSCEETQLVLLADDTLRWYEADERRRGFCARCGGSLFWQLPALLKAVGASIRTDLPTDRLPTLAATMDEAADASMIRTVIKFPLVHPLETRYGDGQDPDLAAILAVAADLFPEPGGTPVPWSTPVPSPSP